MIPIFTAASVFCLIAAAFFDDGVSNAFAAAAIICAFGGI